MNITNIDFEKLPLPFPHLKEQEKIASFLNKLNKQFTSVNEQLEETRTFKRALLNKMFTN
jgi:type I restriction enzyme S subunit